MAVRSRGEADRLRQLARAMHFSNETAEAFLSEATAAQARAVASLLELEAEVRERNKRERLYRRARFPQPKSFADYDFSRASMPEGYAPEDLMSLAFLDAAEGFVLHGPTGRGKTHMAIAMGTAAVQAGRAARFFTTADMVLWLKRMRREDRLEAAMRELAKCELLIVDEFGYVPLDVEGGPAVPGGCGLLREEVAGDHHQHRVLEVGNGARRRQARVGDDRPHRPPRPPHRAHRAQPADGRRAHVGRREGGGLGGADRRRRVVPGGPRARAGGGVPGHRRALLRHGLRRVHGERVRYRLPARRGRGGRGRRPGDTILGAAVARGAMPGATDAAVSHRIVQIKHIEMLTRGLSETP